MESRADPVFWLAAAACVFGALGFVLPIAFGLALALAVVSLWKGRTRATRAMAAGALFVSIAGAVLFLGLASSARGRVQASMAQSECRATLRALVLAQKAFFSRTQRYTDSLRELGFRAPPGNQYAYLLSSPGADQGLLPSGADPRLGVGWKEPIAGGGSIGIAGTCPECQVTVACVGQLDEDDALDVWSISTALRTTPQGSHIPAEVPFHDRDDVAE